MRSIMFIRCIASSFVLCALQARERREHRQEKPEVRRLTAAVVAGAIVHMLYDLLSLTGHLIS